MHREPRVGVVTVAVRGRTRRWPWSARVLTVAGVIIVGLGLYFVLIRPPLLPEDERYTGATLEGLQAVAPGVAPWLGHVFRVMGGYMLATLLTAWLAATGFRRREDGAGLVATLAGSASIGLMVG